MDGKNTETVVLRKRPALSPTTPRTRAERDFGLRLARTPTKGPAQMVRKHADLTDTCLVTLFNQLFPCSPFQPNDRQIP